MNCVPKLKSIRWSKLLNGFHPAWFPLVHDRFVFTIGRFHLLRFHDWFWIAVCIEYTVGWCQKRVTALA